MFGIAYNFKPIPTYARVRRRAAIDKYAVIAQASAAVPIALYCLYASLTALYVVATKRRREVKYRKLTQSQHKQGRPSFATNLLTVWRRMTWWLDSEILLFGYSWGTWDQWVFGTVWGVWLLTLCVLDTGQDLIHLTKRFGTIAMAQSPLLYLLSVKSVNPLCFVFSTSHERLNRYHRVLGRLVWVLMTLHGNFYLTYFLLATWQPAKLFEQVKLIGMLSAVLIGLLQLTALAWMRHYSYRVFIIVHVLVSIAVPVLLFWHAAQHVKFYLMESLFIFVVDLAVRRIDTFTVANASVELIPDTDLIRIVVPVPPIRASAAGKLGKLDPGSHVFVSLPISSRPKGLKDRFVFEFLSNPFTIASMSSHPLSSTSSSTISASTSSVPFTDDNNHRSASYNHNRPTNKIDNSNPPLKSLTLVARRHSGPLTSRLAHFTSSSSFSAIPSPPSPAHWYKPYTATCAAGLVLNIEGPYGGLRSAKMTALAQADRVLLVAGGVGGTFILPLWRALLRERRRLRGQFLQGGSGGSGGTVIGAGTDGEVPDNDDGDQGANSTAFQSGESSPVMRKNYQNQVEMKPLVVPSCDGGGGDGGGAKVDSGRSEKSPSHHGDDSGEHKNINNHNDHYDDDDDDDDNTVAMVWAVRRIAELRWASFGSRINNFSNDGSSDGVLPHSIAVYLTGDNYNSDGGGSSGRTSSTHACDHASSDNIGSAPTSNTSPTPGLTAVTGLQSGRPDLARIVDDTFATASGYGSGDSGGGNVTVGVVVCGPTEMRRELRGSVGKWIMRGAKVVWHDEAFG